MKFRELVRIRQSIRNYSSMPVPRDSIDKCIEAARFAPSACNSQPWSFIIIDDPDLKNSFADVAFSGIYSLCSFARNAPVIIAVITKKSSYAASLGSFFKGTQFNLIDIGIACEHLILQATEEGLGSCWLGWFNEKKVKKFLDVPNKTNVDILISLGYPADDAIREKVRKSLPEIRHYYTRM